MTTATETTLSVTITTRLKGLCAAGDRYTLDGAQIHARDGLAFAAATNGKAAAVAEAQTDSADHIAAIIPSDVLPAAAKGDTVTLNGQWSDSKGKKTAAPIDGEGPPIADVLPDVESRQPAMIAVEHDLELTIDAALLLAMARGITDGKGEHPDVITLFVNTDKPAAPIAAVGDRGIGVIMPSRADHDPRRVYNDLRAQYRRVTK